MLYQVKIMIKLNRDVMVCSNFASLVYKKQQVCVLTVLSLINRNRFKSRKDGTSSKQSTPLVLHFIQFPFYSQFDLTTDSLSLPQYGSIL